MVAPQTPDESEIIFAKRCVAVKANEHENSLILPKSAKETDAEFEERLAKAKEVQVMIFPRGKHETNAHWKLRLSNAAKTKLPIMPKSADEPERGFQDRCQMQRSCSRVIHPFDPEREDQRGYTRRLEANKQRSGLGFEPGDNKAINAVLGEPKKHEVEHHEDHHVDGKALMTAKLESLENLHHEEEESAAKIQQKLAAEEAAKKEAEEEQQRVEERIAQMKVEQEQERKRKEEEEANKGFDLERIAINKVGFMPLKKLLMERGVPKEQVFACANKFALMEVAKKWGPELKIEWFDDSVVEVS